jgi:long-chain acyl-CoA synthetase
MQQRLNIARTIFRETAALSGKTALLEGSCTLTYGQLAQAVDRLAQELAEQGVRPLDRVAFLCPDCIDYVLLSLAILSLDAAIIPISPGLMTDERAVLPEQMDVHHILADAAFAPDRTGTRLRNTADLTHTFQLTPRTPIRPLPTEYAAIRPAFIRFSSGTTGTSKGVVLSHEAILDRTDAANQGLHITSGDRIGWVLSMSFHFVVTILLFLRKGATVVLCGDPLPDALIQALQQHPITLLYASPIHYQLLTLSQTLTARHFAAVRMAISTAVKLPAPIAQGFFDRFGLRLTEAYGIIEVGLPFIHCPPAQSHDGLLGKPLPDYTVKLGVDNEVLIRGKGMFDAYFSPWQPRAVCQPDGWFHTGDVGERSADGSLRLVGRCKAVINFAGMKIFPQEIEEILNQHPSVSESLVHGEAHPEYGQIPCAKIVLRAGSTFDAAALQAFCRARLATHKIPKAFTCVPDLVKTASGKIRRT